MSKIQYVGAVIRSTGSKLYENSRVARSVYNAGKTCAKPVLEMKNIYTTTAKESGKITALKAIIKEKGICGPVFAGVGGVLGTVTNPFIGVGLITATAGYGIGHLLDLGIKFIGKGLKHSQKLLK